jgi:hypothetical protein
MTVERALVARPYERRWSHLCSLTEAVKTCDGFGTFYRLDSEEERGPVQIKTATDEVLFKVFGYGRGSDGRAFREGNSNMRGGGST